MSSIEDGRELELYEESWIKRAYREEWPTLVNGLVSSACAVGLSAGVSYMGSRISDSDAGISAAATVADAAGFWMTFIPQLMYRDRKKMSEDGNLSPKRIWKKAAEYLGYTGIMEGSYFLLSGTAQYYLQKQGWDPATASTAVRSTLLTLYLGLSPPLRYALRHFSEK